MKRVGTVPGRRWIAIASFAILAALSGCNTSPPVRYFTLSSMSGGASQATDEAMVLGVGPLRLPAYLDRRQVVTRRGGSELEMDEFGLWAEPLEPAVMRVLAANLDVLLEQASVVAFPWQPALDGTVLYRLYGEIDRFDADTSGRVVLELQWGISKMPGNTIVAPRRARYTASLSVGNDPAAVAAAMSAALEDFSRDAALALQTIIDG